MIQITDLRKSYGKLDVLRGVNASFCKGEITAILGPNGSGKTTLIKSILGLVKPSSGAVEVNGSVVNGNFSYRREIGYMPQIARYPENLTVEEVIDLVKDLRNSKDTEYSEIAASLNLVKEMKKPFKSLSGGTRQKVSALLALMFNPSVLILDEPTSGLDPVSSSYLKDILLKEKQKGKTIIITSHNMSEIQELSTKIVFLLEGKIRYNGAAKSLMYDSGEVKLEKALAKLMNGVETWN